ncbi:MAG: Serine/threonine-protein kinase pkn1 [Pseudomonadota bacterium]|jgi:serine/threonine-protein kinase
MLSLRADWFAATAALPDIYNRFLQQGETRQALDAKLGIDVNQNLKDKKVIRAGFKNSGVSSFNRMIERHDQVNGLGYWISYDFGNLGEEENLFIRPLGPRELLEGVIPDEIGDPVAFKHDGGEVIYHLPNGLFGYYLATADGKRIDKGPTFIVRQDGAPTQFVSAIVNGVSCMNCHNAGIIKKDDDVKRLTDDLSSREPNAFSARQKQLIAELYVPPATMNKKMDDDNELYFKALKELGIDREKPDPVIEAFRIYNRNLVKEDLAHELTLESDLFSQIFASKTFARLWGALTTQGTYISRDEFQSGIALISSIKGFAEFLKDPKKGQYVITAACMFKDQLKMDKCYITKHDAEVKLQEAEKAASAAGQTSQPAN